MYGRSTGKQVEFDAYSLLRRNLSRNKNYNILSLVNIMEKELPWRDLVLEHPDWKNEKKCELCVNF